MPDETFTHRRTRRSLPLLDLGAALVVYAAAFLVRIWVPLPFTLSLLPTEKAAVFHAALPLILISQIPLLYVFGLYDRAALRRGAATMPGVIAALAVQLSLITAWYFFLGDLPFPRTVLLLFTAGNMAAVETLRRWARRRLQREASPTRLLLVGAAADVEAVRVQLHDSDPRGELYSVTGVIDPQSDGDAALTQTEVDVVVLVSAESWEDRFLDRVLHGGPSRTRVAVVPTVYDLLVARPSSLSIREIPLMEVARHPHLSLSFHVKEATDSLIAAVLLAVSAPICLLAMLGIRLTSPGPVLFKQARVGRDGREFTLYKLRTMYDGAESSSGPVLATPGDARVTPIGRWLRASRLDELPQLWNVLTGTMSLVGPRPERPEFARRFAAEIPGYAERWVVKPGMTGLAQVRGGYHTPPAHKLKYDLAYIYNYTLTLDGRIILETIKTLVGRRGV